MVSLPVVVTVGWLARSHGGVGGAVGDLTGYLVRSTLWHVVGRVVRSVPLPAALALGGVACVLFLLARRGRVRT